MPSSLFAAQWGAGLSQDDLMIRDECIAVSPNDEILGHTTKLEAHRFDDPRHPNGVLHRAFSVFLFNSEGKLLLQQRAADKITFPSVWTNTCCSHPLYGQEPCEVDGPEAVKSGNVIGIKFAALRKLQHELGIDPDELMMKAVPVCPLTAAQSQPTAASNQPEESSRGHAVDKTFKYLGRIHYAAADEGEKGNGAAGGQSGVALWGEHEVDYMLFVQTRPTGLQSSDSKGGELQLRPNSEEISDTRYVDQAELAKMMAPESGLKWSPWFRYIATHPDLLPKWWGNLEKTLMTNDHVDLQNIVRF
jgi:isopentenyl-diphosphate Delta-isomerase